MSTIEEALESFGHDRFLAVSNALALDNSLFSRLNIGGFLCMANDSRAIFTPLERLQIIRPHGKNHTPRMKADASSQTWFSAHSLLDLEGDSPLFNQDGKYSKCEPLFLQMGVAYHGVVSNHNHENLPNWDAFMHAPQVISQVPKDLIGVASVLAPRGDPKTAKDVGIGRLYSVLHSLLPDKYLV